MNLRKTLTLLAALAPLAGCGLIPLPPSPLPPPRSEAEANCQRQANDDPVVREIQIKRLASDYNANRYQNDYVLALKQANDRCLNKLGIFVPGGVEPVRGN